MIVGGIQKNSMIDYPGKIACVLFLSGCNFDCPYCHNPQLVNGRPPDCDQFCENRLYSFLKERKSFLDGVVISGGEPTLQADLPELCARIKHMGYPVKLDTNGSRPQVLKQLIADEMVDYLAMDIKTDPFAYAPVIKKDIDPNDILASIGIIMNCGLPYEFKTTCVSPLVDDDVVLGISQTINGAQLYALQQFNPVTVLHPEFFENSERFCEQERLQRFKAIAEPWVKRCIIR